MIVHIMKKVTWEKRKDLDFWGEENLEMDGFIHCCTIPYLWRVAHTFQDISEPLVIVCIDEKHLQAEVRYDEDHRSGRRYPHIYGLVNREAVVSVLPYLKDENGHYQKNDAFMATEDE